MSEIEISYIENHYEINSEFLKKSYLCNEFQNESEKNQILLFKSLLRAGYYLNVLDLIDRYLANFSLNNLLKKELLLIQCEACLYSYNFDRGKSIFLKLISIVEKNDIKNETDNFKFQLDFHKLFFNYNRNEALKSDSIIANYYNIIKEKEDQDLLIEYYTKSALYYRRRHEFLKSINFFEIALNNYSVLGNIYAMAEIYYQLGYSYLIMDKTDLSIQNFEQSVDLFEKLNIRNRQAGALSFLGYAYYKAIELKKAEKYILQSLNIPKVYEGDYFDLYAKINLAELYSTKGQINKSLECFLEAELGHIRFGNKKLLGEILNDIGRLYSAQGKFELAFSNHQRAKDIFDSINDPLGIPWTLIYIGKSLFEMGDYDNSIDSWAESLNIFMDLNDKHGQGFSSLYLGDAHLVLNDGLALSYYKQSRQIFEEIQNINILQSYIGEGIVLEEMDDTEQSYLIISKAKKIITEANGVNIAIEESLYRYGILSIQYSLGKTHPENSPQYLDLILSYLDKMPDSPKTEQRRNFFTAIKLRSTQRLKEQYESLKLLESIISSDIIDYQTFILAYLYIFEAKIFELKVYRKPEIILEANNILNEMVKLTSFSLSAWTAKILALQARMKVLELKFDEAKKCLNDAIQIAVLKSMNRIAFQFSNQYDEMVNTIVDLEKNQASDLTLNERLDIMDLTIFDSDRNKFSLQIPDEEPVYLSLITTQGITLFSHPFGLFSSENFDQLISGFLVAINSVILKLFSSSGFIERIKNKEYTITLYTLLDPIHICYAYKGFSYHAQKKIELFKDLLIKEHLVEMLMVASNKNKILNDNEIIFLTEKLNKIFK